jgi:hypothetical protein
MMASDVYRDRIIELFKSGAATPGQWAAAANCVLIASCEDAPDEKERAGIKLIEDAIGFMAAQKVCFDEEDARLLPERRAALAAAGSEAERMRMIVSDTDATFQRAEQAGDRAWRATLRRLKIRGRRASAKCATRPRAARA